MPSFFSRESVYSVRQNRAACGNASWQNLRPRVISTILSYQQACFQMLSSWSSTMTSCIILLLLFLQIPWQSSVVFRPYSFANTWRTSILHSVLLNGIGKWRNCFCIWGEFVFAFCDNEAKRNWIVIQKAMWLVGSIAFTSALGLSNLALNLPGAVRRISSSSLASFSSQTIRRRLRRNGCKSV